MRGRWAKRACEPRRTKTWTSLCDCLPRLCAIASQRPSDSSRKPPPKLARWKITENGLKLPMAESTLRTGSAVGPQFDPESTRRRSERPVSDSEKSTASVQSQLTSPLSAWTEGRRRLLSSWSSGEPLEKVCAGAQGRGWRPVSDNSGRQNYKTTSEHLAGLKKIPTDLYYR